MNPPRLRRRPREWHKLRVLTFNTHVGLAIPALAWLLAKFGVAHVILVQEVSRAEARRTLARAFPAKTWWRVGPAGQDSDPLVGTFVLARRRRFDRIGVFNDRISDAQPPVDGKAMFPQRNLIAGFFLDLRTGWEIDASSVHTWHMVGRELDGDGVIARGHRQQIDAYAKHHATSSRAVGTRAAAEGFNRSVNAVGNVVRVLTRRVIRVPFRTADHPAVLVTLEVREIAPIQHGRIQLSGGDWNEDPLQSHAPANVRPTMERAGLKPAAVLAAHGDREARLDEVFIGARIGGRS